MRNLKKILAMVLALVMSLSLMATAGAASFQDVTDDNPYKTAIDVLDGLKVFQGFEDGSFKPTDSLNRAQAAVLVYRIATGDAEGKQVDNYTYMAQSKFTDLEGYNWAKGYINYCQNAGIVVGTSATTFDPGAPVTGYQLMVMLLRTLGYGKAGEFTDPKGWELQTAKIAEREGLLKNVVSGDFGAPAQRQMVAEILFRGLLHDTMQYSPLIPDGYTKSGEILGKRVGLEEVTGVITANEVADLYGSSTLKDGTTELTTDSKTYTVNISTTMDDLGEARHAYLQNGKTVLAMDGKEELNSTAETVNKANDLKALLKEANASLSSKSGSETEHYVNFDFDGKWTTDYRIRYVLKYNENGIILGTEDPEDATKGTDAAKTITAITKANPGATVTPKADEIVAKKAGEISVLIKPKGDVSSTDIKWMKHIFANGDLPAGDKAEYEVGQIYVNTQSNKDISDDPDYSYELFEEKFLKYIENSETVGSNENDNWLKVIDNDGDGIAEYVLKVVYTMTDVVRVRDEKITLGTQDDVMTGRDKYNNITADNEIVCADELAVDDIVYYALIDGDIQATKVEPVTVTIDKRNLNKKTVTTTGDAVEYQNSGVSEMIDDAAYTSDVLGMAGKVSYDLYLGRGGHVIAYVETNLTNAFTLITNGWYMSQRGGAEYAVMTYNDESAALEDVTVTTGAKRFIDGQYNNNWGQLRYFGKNGALNAEGKAVWTTVAALQDETLLPVDSDSVSTRNKHEMIDVDKDKDGSFVIPRAAYVTGDIYESNATLAYEDKPVKDANVELRATSDTIYYYVYPDTTADKNDGKNVVVKSYTGYDNAPKPVAGKDTIEDVYAVGTAVTRAGDYDKLKVDYYTADVVVVEFSSPYVAAGEAVFVYDSYLYNKEVSQYNVDLINSKGEVETEVAVSNKSIGGDGDSDKKFMPGAYWRYPTSTEGLYLIERMSTKDAAKNFMIGQITTSRAVEERDFADVACLYNDGKTVAKYEQPKLGADSAYYQLNYAKDAKKDYHIASLNDKADHIDVLPEGVERVLKGDEYDKAAGYREFTAKDNKVDYDYYRNDVLVYAPKGTIVYAVSFRNFGDEYDTKYVDYAQDVWKSMLPADDAQKTNWPQLFNGEIKLNEADVEKGITVTTDEDTRTKDITVPYNVWKAWGASYTVKPFDTHNKISVDNGKDDTMGTSKGWLVTADNKAGTQTIIVMSQGDKENEPTLLYKFNITLTKQNTDFGDLIIKAAKQAEADKAGITVTNKNVDEAAINVTVASGTKIETLGEVLGVNLADNSAENTKATITLEVRDATGKVDENMLHDTVDKVVGTGMTLWATINNGEYEKTVQITVTGTVPTPAEPSITPDGKVATVTPKADEILTTLTDTDNTDKDYPVDATTEGGTTEVTKASFDKNAIDVLKDHAETVTVTGDNAEVKVPVEAIEKAIGDNGVTKTVDIVAAEGTAPDDVTLPTGSVVADVTIEVDGTKKSIEGLTEKIAITLKAPTGANNGDVVNVWVVTDSGLVQVPAKDVKPVAGGKVTFYVDHLTQFAIVKNLDVSGVTISVLSQTNEPTITKSENSTKIEIAPTGSVKWSESRGETTTSNPRGAGWWIGIKITIPSGWDVTKARFVNSSDTYDKLSKLSADKSDGKTKSFNAMKDSGSSTPAWMESWSGIGADELTNGIKKSYAKTLYFNWDGDESTGTTVETEGGITMKGVDQIITQVFTTAELTLLGEDNNKVWEKGSPVTPTNPDTPTVGEN